MPLPKQDRIQRKSGERRVAAENAGREQEPDRLRGIALEGEISRQQSHRERSCEVHEHRGEWEADAQPPSKGDVDGVAEGCTQAAAEEHDNVAHWRLSFVRASTWRTFACSFSMRFLHQRFTHSKKYLTP